MAISKKFNSRFIISAGLNMCKDEERRREGVQSPSLLLLDVKRCSEMFRSDVHKWTCVLCLIKNLPIAHTVQIGLRDRDALVPKQPGQGLNIYSAL